MTFVEMSQLGELKLENKVSAETAKKKRSKASFFIYNLFN